MLVRVAIDLALDRLFDYEVPKELEKKLAVGQLLSVPFGHRTARGFAMEIGDEGSGVRGQESGVRGQGSGVRGQGSGSGVGVQSWSWSVRGQESVVESWSSELELQSEVGGGAKV